MCSAWTLSLSSWTWLYTMNHFKLHCIIDQTE
uniref:Uncharacterized protein n=1 Tax=Anguilla anguilla TaxID=7936 RepID=A0A0E9WGJ5_ANGAN